MRPLRERTIVAATRYALCRKAGCQRDGDHARGLCESCYKQTIYYIGQGVTTWAKLERQGKVAKPEPTLKEWLLS